MDYYGRNPREDGYGRMAEPHEVLECAGRQVVLDVETTGLHPWPGLDEIIGIGYYCPDGGDGHERYGYICTADYSIDLIGNKRKKEVTRAFPDRVRINQSLKHVADLVATEGTILFGHNLKFDAEFLRIPLWQLQIPYYDTTSMIHLYDSRLSKSMAKAEEHFLGTQSKRSTSGIAMAGVPKTRKYDFTLWPLDSVADYCVNDCLVTHQLALVLKPKLIELNLIPLLNKEMAYLGRLQQIETRGIRLETEYCKRAIEALGEHLEVLERKLYDATGQEFNWRSYRQMSAAIWEGIGKKKPNNPFLRADGTPNNDHPLGKKYNDWCTAQDVLDHEDHPLAGLIADIRETYKLQGTVEGWFDLVDVNGFIHSNFNATGTRTGRLSSSKPNLQNIAAAKRKRVSEEDESGAYRSDEYKLRQAFVARPGHKIISADHSQQEIRLLAILSEDPTLLEALQNREDMHGIVARQIWGNEHDFEENYDYYRGLAKNIHFAILYGLSLGAMAFRTGMDLSECERIMAEYWMKFPKVAIWKSRVEKSVGMRKYVRYWSGRIWREDDDAKAYKGVNAIIQGGSADLMSIAVLRIAEMLDKTGYGKIVSIIHDEVLVEVKEEYVDEAAQQILQCMEVEDLFGYPFAADYAVGDSYGSLKEDDEDKEFAEEEEESEVEYA